MSVSLKELLSVGRHIKNMTLREVEEATGISNPFISQIESGKCEPSFRNAVKLCDLYGIPVEMLAKAVRENKKNAI